jgi:hypothetical protein
LLASKKLHYLLCFTVVPSHFPVRCLCASYFETDFAEPSGGNEQRRRVLQSGDLGDVGHVDRSALCLCFLMHRQAAVAQANSDSLQRFQQNHRRRSK